MSRELNDAMLAVCRQSYLELHAMSLPRCRVCDAEMKLHGFSFHGEAGRLELVCSRCREWREYEVGF